MDDMDDDNKENGMYLQAAIILHKKFNGTFSENLGKVKFIYSEKATKMLRNLHLFLTGNIWTLPISRFLNHLQKILLAYFHLSVSNQNFSVR